MKRFTGLLDKNKNKIYEGDLLKTGMRRGDPKGWTTERVVRRKTGFSFLFIPKYEFVLKDLYRDEWQPMQMDSELRELDK